MELILQRRFGCLQPSLSKAHMPLSVLVFICSLCCIMWPFIIVYFLASVPKCVFSMYLSCLPNKSVSHVSRGCVNCVFYCPLFRARRSHHLIAKGMGVGAVTLGRKASLCHFQTLWPVKTHFTSLNFISLTCKTRSIPNTSFTRLMWNTMHMKCLTQGLSASKPSAFSSFYYYVTVPLISSWSYETPQSLGSKKISVFRVNFTQVWQF